MFTANALLGIKKYIQRTVLYARYKVGSNYYRTDIKKISINSSGQVEIDFIVDHTLPGDIKITEVQLFDTENNLWLSKAESITRKARQEGVFYRFTIDVREV